MGRQTKNVIPREANNPSFLDLNRREVAAFSRNDEFVFFLNRIKCDARCLEIPAILLCRRNASLPCKSAWRSRRGYSMAVRDIVQAMAEQHGLAQPLPSMPGRFLPAR